MAFNSINYFIFLLPAVVLFYLVPQKFRNTYLLLISLGFFAFAQPEYLLLIAALILINYWTGIAIYQNAKKSKNAAFLYIGLVVNLGVLIFYKYWNFLIKNTLALVGWEHTTTFGNPLINIILPLGLSYYTFQNIGYLIDIYRGGAYPEKSFLHFSLFTLFFPKLPVGPIERTNHFLPQLEKPVFFNFTNFTEGAKRIGWGIFKKLVVADRIAIYEHAVMMQPSEQSGVTVLFASLLYTVQVYADFSGYTDIAIGTARLFGFDLIENFRQPLFAKNVGDFWRRWHISLSSWVNDYIFNPIVLKRRDWGNWGVFYALVISFVIIGLWHGASWNYAVFGLMQAAALIYETATKKKRKKLAKKAPPVFYNLASIALTFLFISASLVVFRTSSFEAAIEIFRDIFRNPGGLFFYKANLLFMLTGSAILIFYDFSQMTKFKIFLYKNPIVTIVSYAALLIFILMAGVFDGGQFIYFAF